MPYRVKDPTTGHEYTAAALADGLTEVDKPAVDVNGVWLPPKYHVALSKKAASKATTATTEAEEATA